MSIIKKESSLQNDKVSLPEFDLDNEYLINFVDLDVQENEHTHGFIEFVYTLGGKGKHVVDGEEYLVRSGDMLLINRNSKHTVIPIENLRYVDIMLKPEYVDGALKGANNVFSLLRLKDFSELTNSVNQDKLLTHFDGEERNKIEFVLDWTREEQSNLSPARDLVIHSALSMLLSLIFRKMAEKQSLRLTINEGLLDFIKQNCCSGLSISDVATKCGYTPEHFSRIFKKYTGKTPISYLNDCKISTAKKLLSSSDLSIELIMQKCGFTNRTLFFKRFLKSVGCTPLQFRKSKKDTF